MTSVVDGVEVLVEKRANVTSREAAALPPRVDHAVAPVEVELAPVSDEGEVEKGPGWDGPEVVVVW